MVAIDGTDGLHVALVLGVLLAVVAIVCFAAAALTLRAAGPPAPVGWALSALGVAALVWTVVVIVRYAEGGTLMVTAGRPPFSANLGAGAVVALVGAGGAVLLGAALALQAPWAARDAQVAVPAGPDGALRPHRR